MSLQKMKPTSPGRRHVVAVKAQGLHKGSPYAPLLESKKSNGGRNNHGHITTRHQGGGHKQHYRLIGSTVHCVELRHGKGAQLARSAGAAVQLVAREGEYATIRLRSGEMRKVHSECRAVIGEVSNFEHNLRHWGKAGARRWKGIRPTVRGVVMNPVDHPHGGGEGKSGQGNPHPVSPWGQKTKGLKTRKNKRTQKFIVRSRHKK